MRQGTPEWLEWRRQGVGSSEVPSLMGESDFSTPLEIWRIKTGRDQEQTSSWAMQRGTDAEPKIRALYELQYDVDTPPCLVEHQEHSYLRVSLDGYNAEQSLVVEFKYPGKDKHQEAIDGKVPRCYYGQVQYQLAVTGAQLCHYVSFNGSEIAIVPVKRDEEYIERMLQVVKSFWESVLNDIPPALTQADFKILDDQESVALFNAWRSSKLMMLQIEESLEDLAEQIRAKIDHPKILCAGVQVLQKKTKNGPVIDIRLKEEKVS